MVCSIRNVNMRRFLMAVLISFFMINGVVPCIAQSRVDVGEFVKEIMKLDIKEKYTQLAIWIPFEFYVASNSLGTNQSREEIERELEYLHPYITLIIQCSLEKTDGTSEYLSEREVRNRAVLRLKDGKEIPPLEEVPPMVSATVSAMKEIMMSEGDVGSANMHILIFPNKNEDGNVIVDENRRDKLVCILKKYGDFKETVFTWHTPFDALFPNKKCPHCGENISAKWSFCPWCGGKLEE